MKKRIVCLWLALVLCCTCSLALARDYTLQEKLLKQVDEGSGLKGSVTLSASGDTETARLLQGLFTGATLEIRAIQSASMRQVQAYFLQGEAQKGLTQLFTDEQTTGLRSELVPGQIITFDAAQPLLDQLTGHGADMNPTWYTAAQELLKIDQATWDEAWAPALAPYETALEMWLNTYAPAPTVVRGEDGTTTMQVIYDVPAKDACAEITSLVRMALADDALRTLLGTVLTPSQAAAYLDPDRADYYAQVLEGLSLSGNVRLSRVMSVQGEDLRTTVELPLAASMTGFDFLAVEKAGEDLSITLSGPQGDAALTLQTASASAELDRYAGTLTLSPEGGTVGFLPVSEGFSGTFELTRTVNDYTEEDGRAHDVTDWKLLLTPEETAQNAGDAATATDLASGATELHLTLHYHGKNAKSSPTTLIVTASLRSVAAAYSVEGTFKTTSPWVMQELGAGTETAFASLDEAGRQTLWTEAGTNLAKLVAELAASVTLPEATQTETPAEPATATDMAEASGMLEDAADAPTDAPATAAP